MIRVLLLTGGAEAPGPHTPSHFPLRSCSQNVVLYAGGAEDRAIVYDNELFYKPPGRGRIQRQDCKVEALLVSYEMLLKEKAMFSRFT